MAGKTKTNTSVSSKTNLIPLVIEPHPEDYNGYPFITLIQYRKQHMLVVVDNLDAERLRAYVLDLCGPEGVNEAVLIDVVAEWWEQSRSNFPLSVEFSRRNMTSQTSALYRSFNVDSISRIIGPVTKFPISGVKSEKRRRKKSIPPGVEINNVVLLDVE